MRAWVHVRKPHKRMWKYISRHCRSYQPAAVDWFVACSHVGPCLFVCLFAINNTHCVNTCNTIGGRGHWHGSDVIANNRCRLDPFHWCVWCGWWRYSRVVDEIWTRRNWIKTWQRRNMIAFTSYSYTCDSYTCDLIEWETHLPYSPLHSIVSVSTVQPQIDYCSRCAQLISGAIRNIAVQLQTANYK